MIVLPMAGLSQRFTQAGYRLPKYMLQAHNKSVFAHVLSSFDAYFETEPFLFICRDIENTPIFIKDECRKLGIAKPHIVTLNATTRGQAETVYLGLKEARMDDAETLTIFNIDTLRPQFRFPSDDILQSDGYLEVFESPGDNWSFVCTTSAEDMTVLETAEKRRISNLCSTGLYYFRKISSFLDAFEQEALKPSHQWDAKELYVAPLYNYLIKRGMVIKAVKIEKDCIIPCGTPQEYEAFIQTP